jgi:isoamyl acetate esterase
MILAIGDSLTQFGTDLNNGWITKLQQIYIRKLDVLNRGLSGYTTKWYPLEVCDNISSTTTLVIVWLGANDASLPPSIQHVPIDQYKHNLCTILNKIENKCKNIILITPPPLDEQSWPDRKNKTTFEYRNAVIELSQQRTIPVLDTWRLFQVLDSTCSSSLGLYKEPSQPILDNLLSDGLHLSSKGNELIYNSLLQLISSQFPLLNPDRMDPVFKWWRDCA